MQIIDNKALCLRVRNPHKITAVIPKSKVIAHYPEQGAYDVLVHWGLEEAQVLKNLGLKKIPSPILSKYNWPGMYRPFDHQRSTAAFLTMHQRCYNLSEPGCVDAETEYLSPTGWKSISNYTGGKVAQYHPTTGEAEFVDPQEYVKLPCDTMIQIKTKYGLDQMLSPEHRILIEDSKARLTGRQKLETVSAAELFDRHNNFHDKIPSVVIGNRKAGTTKIAFSAAAIPTVFTVNPSTSLAISDIELRLQVAVIADGHFNSGTNRCVVRLKKERKILRLREILEEANVVYKERLDESFSGSGFTVFSFEAPRRDKEFTEYYWNASASQLHLIADECQYWDSCTTRGFRFSTFVKNSADFIQYAIISCGYTARLLAHSRDRRGKTETEYVVQVRPEKALLMKGPHRNLKVVPSTDGYKYCFRVPSTYLIFRRNGCVFASGNTGKTSACAWAADYLMTKKVFSRVLVICPLSIMGSAWRGDLFRTLMHRRVDIAHGSPEKRRKVIESDAEFVIINFDGVEVVLPELKKAGFGLVVIDEANAVKTHTTDRWKAINSVCSNTWLWMLTGTPASQSPADAYGLARMMRPQSVPPYYGSFRDMVMNKITQFKWAPKPNARDTVFNVLQPAIRYTKEECLDLPEILYTTRNVPLSPQQRKYYDLLKKQFLMEAGGESVSAVNAAVNINKLLQISAGAVYTDDKNVIEFDIKERYRALMEAIEESTNKILVFVPFRHSITLLQEKLTKDNIVCDVIHGGISPTNRTDIFNKFQTTPDPRVLIIQPAAASHGVTLHAANTVVWWGPVTSFETYTQANARVHRAGQKNPCLVVRLSGSKVEDQLYKALETREEAMFNLLDLYKEEMEGAP